MLRLAPSSAAYRKVCPALFVAMAKPVYTPRPFDLSVARVAWLAPVLGSMPSTPGFQPLIVPSNVAKMKRDRPDLPFSVTVKSVAFGLMFPTVPAGVPRVPGGLLGAGAIVTRSGI